VRRVSANDPTGIYRRRIRVVATEPGVVVSDLEDDYHRFRVTLHHDGTTALSLEGESLRFPWSTCPEAAVPLHALDGTPLSVRVTAAAEHADPRANCTHMFDLAGLAIAHATRGIERRQYDVELPARVDRRTQPKLWRDGELLLAWTIEGRELVDPPPYSEVPWRGGFMAWADEALDPDTAEAAIVLRRACDIGKGRGIDLDQFETAEPLAEIMEGVCYTMTRPVIEHAARNKVSMRDFDDDPNGLLAHDDD
jgi:hypothetical protein